MCQGMDNRLYAMQGECGRREGGGGMKERSDCEQRQDGETQDTKDKRQERDKRQSKSQHPFFCWAIKSEMYLFLVVRGQKGLYIEKKKSNTCSGCEH